MGNSPSIWAFLIAAFGAGGIVNSIVNLLKDRKKDKATAKLSDIEALTRILEYQRKENDDLRKDYERSEDEKRKMRDKMFHLEQEIQKLKLSCDRLSERLRQYIESELHGNTA
jgi:hypothetical protein